MKFDAKPKGIVIYNHYKLSDGRSAIILNFDNSEFALRIEETAQSAMYFHTVGTLSECKRALMKLLWRPTNENA